jgi:CRISPR/Cas system CSM-associated protein Csm2 small subunit
MRKVLNIILFFYIIWTNNFVFGQDLSKIERGKYLTNSIPINKEWSAVPDLVAVEVNKNNKTESRKRISKNKNIEFYEKSKTQSGTVRTLQALRLSIPSNEKAVVYNQDRKTLGLLTGNLIIKVRNKSDLELVINDHGAMAGKLYEQIGRAIIKFSSSTSLESKFQEINQDSRVKSVEYDILVDKVEAH